MYKFTKPKKSRPLSDKLRSIGHSRPWTTRPARNNRGFGHDLYWQAGDLLCNQSGSLGSFPAPEPSPSHRTYATMSIKRDNRENRDRSHILIDLRTVKSREEAQQEAINRPQWNWPYPSLELDLSGVPLYWPFTLGLWRQGCKSTWMWAVLPDNCIPRR